MAMLYAADEKGNKNAARAAKIAAYTEVAEKLRDKIESQPKAGSSPTTPKSSFDDVLGEYQKKFGINTSNKKKAESNGNLHNAETQSLRNDKPENALLTGELAKSIVAEPAKMSKNVSLTVGYIDKIIARTEKLPGSLTKEERGFLETVLNSGTIPLHTKKRIENVLSQPEAKITEAAPDSVHNSVRIRHELTEDFNTKVKNYIKSQARQFMNDTFSPSIVTRIVDGLNNMLNSSDVAKIIGNPELNYYFNKKIDLSKTGAMKGIYINDQDKLKEYAYGIKDIDWGGCGIIAMYNVLQGLNKPKGFAELIRDNEETALLKGWFGTSPYGITNFLRKSGLEVTTDYTNVDNNYDASGADAVIHLYFRNDGSAHYVAV